MDFLKIFLPKSRSWLIKSYRKEVFPENEWFETVLSWDNIDVMLCKMHGFETVTIKELWVKHLRPTAYKIQISKAEKLGRIFLQYWVKFSFGCYFFWRNLL